MIIKSIMQSLKKYLLTNNINIFILYSLLIFHVVDIYLIILIKFFCYLLLRYFLKISNYTNFISFLWFLKSLFAIKVIIKNFLKIIF